MPDGPQVGPVDPRDAFDQLGRLVLADESVESVLQKVADLARAAIPGADQVSVSLVDADRASTVVFTGEPALQLDETQYKEGSGPCLDAIAGGQILRVDDTATESRWPHYAEAAAAQGVRSSMSVPVPLQRYVSAALNVYSRSPEAFDGENSTRVGPVELELELRASVGASLAEPGQDLDAVLHAADAAMYRAKRRQRQAAASRPRLSAQSTVRSGLLEVEVHAAPDEALVLLRGELDVATAATVRSVLDEQAAAGRATVVDLAGLEFVDYTGLCALSDRRVRPDGTPFRLSVRGASPLAVRVMRLGGLTRLLRDVGKPQTGDDG